LTRCTLPSLTHADAFEKSFRSAFVPLVAMRTTWCEQQIANQFAHDSLVFDRIRSRATPSQAHLWKNFWPWVKLTQRRRLRRRHRS
jgi:hypothetical protein